MERAITAQRNEVDIFFRGVETLRLTNENISKCVQQKNCIFETMFT